MIDLILKRAELQLSYKQVVLIDATNQFKRLFSLFKIPFAKKTELKLMEYFQEIWDFLNEGSKYRNTRKLIPIIFYYYCRDRVLLYRSDIIEYSDISVSEFNSFTMQINRFLPNYSYEAKRMRVLKRLLKISESLNLGMDFYHMAMQIISNIPSLFPAKSNIIAAVGATLAKFTLNKARPQVKKITEFFHSDIGRVQYHVKQKLVEKYKIADFTSLVQSREIVAKFIKDNLLRKKEEEKKQPEALPIYKVLKINKYITVQLEGTHTVIYVDNKEFKQCKYLLFNITSQNREIAHAIGSIDDLEEFVNTAMEGKRGSKFHIAPTQEFFAHCSNLQAWVENKYDTRILHRNLAFPLLKELTKAGDPMARRVFKEEIAKRFLSGAKNVIQFLLAEGYLEFLGREEISFIFRSLVEEDIEIDPGSMLMLFNYALDNQSLVDMDYIFKGS